jgi:hypothetical protein
VDADMGQVQLICPGVMGSAANWCGPGTPTEEIRINYEAGATDAFRAAQYSQYQTDWDTTVARFAIAELAQVPAATQKQNPQVFYWREDLAHTGYRRHRGGGFLPGIERSFKQSIQKHTARGG